MKTISAAFEIELDEYTYTVKYVVANNAWKVNRGLNLIGLISETRTHQFKNETRAKEILKELLKSRREGLKAWVDSQK